MTEEPWFTKKPCKSCPFRRDVTPFLHPERAEDIANSACNPYSEFHCHATLGYDDDEGDTMVVETSLVCAGFLAMQITEGRDSPEGFVCPDNVYTDAWEMTDAYETEWNKQRKTPTQRAAAR